MRGREPASDRSAWTRPVLGNERPEVVDPVLPEGGEASGLVRPRSEPALDRSEPVAALVEVLHVTELGRRHQPAVEGIRPAVVLARERLARALADRDRPRAVAAYVVEAVPVAVRVARDDDRRAVDLAGQIRAGTATSLA